MKCFYHSDADGMCAGFWVYQNVGINDLYTPEMHSINYDKPFPFEIINPDEQVYIVDFSISPEDMLKLLEITKDVTWIDHHKTAIEKYKDFPHEIRGVRIDGVAGCMLTYCYIHHMTARGDGEIQPFDWSMTDDAPMFTKLIADYDVWAFKYRDDTRNFVTAFYAYDFSPSSELWGQFLFDTDFKIHRSFIEEGRAMIKYRDNWARGYCKSKGFETNLAGHKCFAMNLGHCNSDYFKSVDDGTYEIFISFCFDGKKWLVSLYSATVDVSEIAKKLGGGGHRGAAGFQCDLLPFIQ